MEDNTYLSNTLDPICVSNGDSIKYDNNIKQVLADKQILAFILKHTLDEFKTSSLCDIISCIKSSEANKIPLDPIHRIGTKAATTHEEDSAPNEGYVRYDVRCEVQTPNDESKTILINLEAQKGTDLPYKLENRITFYMSRMISSQKMEYFIKSEYDNIKPICSIWICMEGGLNSNSIEEVHFNKRVIFGKKSNIDFNLMRAFIITLNANRKSENPLIAMLEDLLSSDGIEMKKKNLESHGLIMTTETEGVVNSMCNLSERLVEQSEARTFIDIVNGMCKNLNKSVEEVLQLMGKTIEEYTCAVNKLR